MSAAAGGGGNIDVDVDEIEVGGCADDDDDDDDIAISGALLRSCVANKKIHIYQILVEKKNISIFKINKKTNKDQTTISLANRLCLLFAALAHNATIVSQADCDDCQDDGNGTANNSSNRLFVSNNVFQKNKHKIRNK